MTNLKQIVQENINKFSFAQMTSNANGKTSSSGTMGVYIIIFSMIAFLYGCIEFHSSNKADIMMYASANILVGAGLLGYRKSKDKATVEVETPEVEVKPEEQPPA
jgi:hypothetical protein